jgi:DNA (cytosine-5)-methyltransferase 3A
MSCGQIALDQLGIPVDNYYAAEIDPYAMRVTQNNFPETIHLGDVTKVKGEDLEKIDLLLGGSPCQGFSFAGKQLNFDDPRSALFFEFVRLLKETNPKYFLLENVRMKKEYQDVITEHLGVEPIMINSALVSAQNRVRLYWTNIPNITQPEDRDIVLKDILENGIATDEMTTSDKKSFCLTARYQGAVAWNSIEKRQRTMVQVGMANDINGHDILKRIYSSEGKSPTLNAHGGGNTEPKVACGALRGRQITPGSKEYTQMLELREDNKTNTLTSVQKDNVLTQDKMYYRKLTPLECERLQTVPDGYTEGVSNTQRYKMLGNGWTVEVIKHVLQNIT